MIKTILVPSSGTSTDEGVFVTALAIARPMSAHLEFYHLRLSLMERAVRTPHVQYCRGQAMGEALKYMSAQDEQLSAAARSRFAEFCDINNIPARDKPGSEGISAHWWEETDQPEKRLLTHARHSDLIVLGRAHSLDLMPSNFIEMMLVGCGRPIVIAPVSPPKSMSGTMVVGWKETPEASRALAAALPILRQARKVVLAAVEDDDASPVEALDDLMCQLAWHGISAEIRLSRDKSKTGEHLLHIAGTVDADLLVVGGFGHAPLRETVFGGVTRTLIERAICPVLMQH